MAGCSEPEGIRRFCPGTSQRRRAGSVSRSKTERIRGGRHACADASGCRACRRNVWWPHPMGVQLSAYKYTPLAVNAHSPLWSPNGKMAVYSGEMGDEEQLFLRPLDLPSPQQLTHSVGGIRPLGWSDSSHILYERLTTAAQPNELLSVASAGREPDWRWTIPTGPGWLFKSADRIPGRQSACVDLSGRRTAISRMCISEPIGSHCVATQIRGSLRIKFSTRRIQQQKRPTAESAAGLLVRAPISVLTLQFNCQKTKSPFFPSLQFHSPLASLWALCSPCSLPSRASRPSSLCRATSLRHS
jgi:hypothetical protein